MELGKGSLNCCGVYPIYGFPFDAPQTDAYTQERLEQLTKAVKTAPVATGCQIAALTSNQKQAQEILKANGFIEVAKFLSSHGDGRTIHIFMKGKSVEKVIKKRVLGKKKLIGAKLIGGL